MKAATRLIKEKKENDFVRENFALKKNIDLHQDRFAQIYLAESKTGAE